MFAQCWGCTGWPEAEAKVGGPSEEGLTEKSEGDVYTKESDGGYSFQMRIYPEPGLPGLYVKQTNENPKG